MTLQSFDAQRYVRRLRYHDRRLEDPERVAVPLALWLSRSTTQTA